MVVLVLADGVFVAVYYAAVRHFVARHAWSDVSEMGVSHYDAGVVFFGSMDGQGLDCDTRRRVEDAVVLYQHHRIREIIAVGGARRDGRPGSEKIAELLKLRGVPAADVRHDSVSYDSFSNWTQALEIARQRGMDSLVLISSPTHLMRLEGIAAGSEVVVAFYASLRNGCPRELMHRWRTAHRESLALLASWILPRAAYAAILKRLRLT